MSKFQFMKYEESTYIVTFVADSFEQAKELMQNEFAVDELPEGDEFWKKGNTKWDQETLIEISNDEETEDNE